VQYTTIILCIRQAGITVIWLVMLIVKGSGLSRRVVRNRGSIDSRREEERNRCICQSKSQKVGVDDSAMSWRKSGHMTC
jgi:hypothetical protein